jgi:hypothetical protein
MILLSLAGGACFLYLFSLASLPHGAKRRKSPQNSRKCEGNATLAEAVNETPLSARNGASAKAEFGRPDPANEEARVQPGT